MHRPLFLFNSMGRMLEEFVPLTPGSVRLYTCGLTVYNYAHLGNLRAYLFTDSLRRVLQLKGYDVLHVMNVTDVGHLTSDADEGGDKMELAAEREAKTIWQIAEYYTRHFQSDLALLGVLPPSVVPRATDHIQEMIAFAQACEAHGYVYMLSDGLYFDTSKVPDYGRLALMNLQGQKEGSRVKPAGGRKNPSDFAVWRLSPADRRRLMEWTSPWGTGAPGWHLECSVMSLKYLGRRFDIHTGGIDHREIHHVNEIAQNQAFLGDGEIGARYWMHNDFLLLNEDKMSKSAGDFVRLQTIIDWGFHPAIYRHFVLSAHYRSKLTFSFEALAASRQGLLRLLRAIAPLAEKSARTHEVRRLLSESRASRGGSFVHVVAALSRDLSAAAREWLEKLDAAISQDLDIPGALALLSSLVERHSALSADDAVSLLGVYDLALGLNLLELTPEQLLLKPSSVDADEHRIDELVQTRLAARRAGDFRKADDIRARLKGWGITLNDSPSGCTWEWGPVKPG